MVLFELNSVHNYLDAARRWPSDPNMKNMLLFGSVSMLALGASGVPAMEGTNDLALRWYLMATAVTGVCVVCWHVQKGVIDRVRELERSTVRIDGIEGRVTSIENRLAKSDSGIEKLTEAIQMLKTEVALLNQGRRAGG